jgi:hypothetical protein
MSRLVLQLLIEWNTVIWPPTRSPDLSGPKTVANRARREERLDQVGRAQVPPKGSLGQPISGSVSSDDLETPCPMAGYTVPHVDTSSPDMSKWSFTDLNKPAQKRTFLLTT